MQRSHLEETASLVRDLLAQTLAAPPGARIWLTGIKEELGRVLLDLESARQHVNERDTHLLDRLSTANRR